MEQPHQAATLRTDRTHSKANPAAVPPLAHHKAIKRCHSSRQDRQGLIHRRRNRTITGLTRMLSHADIPTLRSRASRIPINNDRDCMVSTLLIIYSINLY